MSLKHVFVAVAALLLLSIAACGAGGILSGNESCDPASYPPHCTDNVAFECVHIDCSRNDCVGRGCTCDDSPHVSRKDCNLDHQGCSATDAGAVCK